MERRIRIFSLVPALLALATGTTALAQVVVTTPPRPSNDGPSLGVTMQFLQEKLNDIGGVTIDITAQNTSNRTSFSYHVINMVSSVVADAAQCRISYHWKVESQKAGQSGAEFNGNIGFSLGSVKEIVIESYSQFQNEKFAADGTPQFTVYSAHPDVVILEVRGQHGAMNIFPFTDAELADRVSKAFTHAVELCGGKKDPF